MYQLGSSAPSAQVLQAAQRISRHWHTASAARPASFAGLRWHARQLLHNVRAADNIEPQSSVPPSTQAGYTAAAGPPSTELLPVSVPLQQAEMPAEHSPSTESSSPQSSSSVGTASAVDGDSTINGIALPCVSADQQAAPPESAQQSPATATAVSVPEFIMFTAEELQGTAANAVDLDAGSAQASDVTGAAPLQVVKPAESLERDSDSSNSTQGSSSADVAAELTATPNSHATSGPHTVGSADQQQQQEEELLEQDAQRQQQLLAELQQQEEQQQQTTAPPPSWGSMAETAMPPPLIDPTVDIANDPAFAIRLMDILDQISVSSLNSSNSSAQSLEAADVGKEQPQVQQPTDVPYRFVRQPASFCTNCCTPLDALRPAAACSSCGHLPSNDSLLFALGVSSLNELTAHCPAWLHQHQIATAAAALAAKAVKSSLQDSTKTLSERIEAGIALQQAQQLLRDAGILQLPTTVLAWEDDQTEPEPAMQLHRGLLPPNHERPERLRVVLARLRAAGLLDVCTHLQPREATETELLAVHTPGLIAAVAALSHANQPSDLNQVAAHLAPDMLGNRYTYRAALTAAGTAAELAKQLASGKASNGMAIIRPMGHAAGVDHGEAGNYFNNAAVAVKAAQRAGARRVMVIDWDVHHSKGTSEIFAEDPNVLVFSLHRYGSGFYPGSGAAEHVGVGRGRGRNINVAWCPPTVTDKRGRRVQVEAPPISDGDYLTAWNMLVLPVAAEFRPDVILVSAGFDAADKDPLGHYRLHPELFGHLTALLRPLAPLGLLLEGGYNLAVTAACTEACLRALIGEIPAPLKGTRCAGVTGWSSILRTLLVQQEHWQCLGMLNFLQLATPVAEDWELQDEADEDEDDGYDLGDEQQEEEEQELPEEELSEVLAAAAEPKSAGKSVDDFEPEEVVAAISEAPDLLQQVLDLLDQKIEASKQRQLEEELKAAAMEAAAEQSQQHDLVPEAAAGEGSAAAEAGAAAGRSTSSSSSGASSWSAGGFMDDMESVDSGSDDDSAAKKLAGFGRADWGLDQIDEDVYEHMSWYGARDTQQQLIDAHETAAAAAAQAAADAAAVAAASNPDHAARMAEQELAVMVAAAEAEVTGTAAAAAESAAKEAVAEVAVREEAMEAATAQRQQRPGQAAATVEADEAAAAIGAVAAAAEAAEARSAAVSATEKLAATEAAVEPKMAQSGSAPAVASAPSVVDAPAVASAPAVSKAPAVVDAPAVASAPSVASASAVPRAPAVASAPSVASAPAVVDAPAVASASAAAKAPAVVDAPAVPDSYHAATDSPAESAADASDSSDEE